MTSTASTTHTVKPTALPASSEPWVLTGLDRANLLFVLRGTWVFDAQLAADRLEGALAKLLALYPHLAGRMKAGREVAMAGQGVPWTVGADEAVTVEQVCARSMDHAFIDRFSRPLSIGRVKKGRAAPMTVSLTRLADGCVLGVRVTHSCLDGDGFYTMVSNWGRLARGEPVEPPRLDQSLIPAPSQRSKAEVIREAEALGWRKLPWLRILAQLPRYLLGRLHRRAEAVHFSAQALGRLKEAAALEAGRPDLSTNEALSAHLTRMCVRLVGLRPGTPCEQVTVLNGRGRIPGVPASFAGNAAYTVRSAQFGAGATMGELAAMARDRLAPILAPDSAELLQQVALGIDLLHNRVLRSPTDAAGMHARRPTTIYINNFARMPVYEVDFGDATQPARPVRVIPHNLPDPVLLWPAPPDRGGIEVYLTGSLAAALTRRGADEAWWSDLRRFEEPG